MALLQLIFGLWGLYALSSLHALWKNYLKARQTGLPIALNPINHNHVLWMIVAPQLQKIAAQSLPHFVYSRLIPGLHGGVYIHGWKTFSDFGSIYMYVTPGKAELHIADPDFANGVWSWKAGYKVDHISRKLLSTQGPNVFSSDGEDWKRQRKIVAPLLNERFSTLVWDESSSQAIQMLKHYEAQDPVNNHVCEGLETVAFNVLGAVGYGIVRSWTPRNDGDGAKPEGFFGSLRLQTQNFMVAGLLPTWFLTLPMMPIHIRDIGKSKRDFPIHVQQMIEDEMKLRSEESVSRNNFMSKLVDLLQEKSSTQKSQMSMEEVRGNLFNFSVAGFETTAHTLLFAIVFLAANPQWQAWLTEEIDAVVDGVADRSYEKTFPKLVRCLAFLYEITRVYSPVGNASRTVASPQVVSYTSPATGEAVTHQIPVGICIVFDIQGMHLNPALYGPDPRLFDAKRWINTSSTSTEQDGAVPSLVIPRKGTFIAWSSGPRSCPGIRMAQVEFVAVISAIFKEWTVAPAVRRENGTVQEAENELKNILGDSRQILTLMVKEPENIWLQWQKRHH